VDTEAEDALFAEILRPHGIGRGQEWLVDAHRRCAGQI
jgi:hypothetical protein